MAHLVELYDEKFAQCVGTFRNTLTSLADKNPKVSVT